MPPAAYAHAETEIDFSQRKRGIGRYWHVTLFSALAVTALALFVTGEIPPRYYAESRIAITPAENTDAQSAADDEAARSQVAILGAADLLNRVARDLRLAEHPEFDSGAGESGIVRAAIHLGLIADPGVVAPEDRILAKLRQCLRIEAEPGSNQIAVGFSSSDPTLAAGVPRALVDAYLGLQREMRMHATPAALAWLEREIEEGKARLGAVEARIERALALSLSPSELSTLEREAVLERETLQSYLASYRAAVARRDRGAHPVDARILTDAVVPAEPYFPKPVPIAAVAFAGTLLLAGFLILLRELARGRGLQPAGERPFIAEVSMPDPPAFGDDPERTGEDEAEAARRGEGGTEPPRRGREGLLDIGAAADHLIASGASSAVFLSPEAEAASTVSILVAREIADAGLRVLLLDLTEAGSASRPMLDGLKLPGITDLLIGAAQFVDVIHSDRYSECDIIPVGTADPDEAMREAERLPIIMTSLTTAYDLVIVECGPASAAAVASFTVPEAEMLVSVVDPRSRAIADTLADLRAEGLATPLLVSAATGKGR